MCTEEKAHLEFNLTVGSRDCLGRCWGDMISVFGLFWWDVNPRTFSKQSDLTCAAERSDAVVLRAPNRHCKRRHVPSQSRSISPNLTHSKLVPFSGITSRQFVVGANETGEYTWGRVPPCPSDPSTGSSRSQTPTAATHTVSRCQLKFCLPSQSISYR